MTPKFLREEAARFRGMAEMSDREASKARYLAMATDFEARAQASDAANPPDPPVAPAVDDEIAVKPSARIARGLRGRTQAE